MTSFRMTSLRLLAGILCLGFSPVLLSQEAEKPTMGASEPTTAGEVYGQGVRETAWQAAADELSGFHLPPGFEIELFAAEPQISKPMNMAWDARGRLWVSSTREYPYPAATDAQPRDTIQILEDTDGDGRADKSTTFADGLNIPIGLLPVADGVICFSIPNLWLLRDSDGDDRVDERIKLLGPFDTTRDTHGMINSLHRGDDGWIYACHGFNNQSQVSARDGSSVKLTSGNTFRFKADGSRVEHFTHGQVNPFGMTCDQWGNWYTADCHSKPLTALIPGGYYPSFGRPHDGLGFAPEMMKHLHGSTAICGLLYYQAQHFPAAFRQRFYSGNVMTSRINCNALQWQGATATAEELPDFLTSDDPWFRPVDLQLGPDGRLYVADFYNKIIGHYEVPLEHPERDRDSGRIWRISYRGSEPHLPPTDLAINQGALLEELSCDNESRRKLAIENALASKCLSADDALARFRDPHQSEPLRLSCLELLIRQGNTQAHSQLLPRDSQHQQLLVRQLALASELPQAERRIFAKAVRAELPYTNAHANLVACRLLAIDRDYRDLGNLAHFAASTQDPALKYAARVAARELLRDDALLQSATAAWTAASRTTKESPTAYPLDSPAADFIANVLPAVGTPLAAIRLLDYLDADDRSQSELADAAIVAATQHADDALVERLLQRIGHSRDSSLALRVARFEKLCEAYLIRKPVLSKPLVQFGRELQRELAIALAPPPTVRSRLAWRDASHADWKTEQRQASGNRTDVLLRSSLTLGESYTGQLVSDVFPCPAKLQFLVAGHNGYPQEPDSRLNRIELELVDSGQTVQTAYPPRSDVAVPVEWTLTETQGRSVRLRIIDADKGNAYAWIAVGQFSNPELNAAENRELFSDYLVLARRGFSAMDAATVRSIATSESDRAALVVAGLSGGADRLTQALAAHAVKLGRTDLVDTELLTLAPLEEQRLAWAKQVAAASTISQQRELATKLVNTTDGCELLQQLLQAGALSDYCLRDLEWQLPEALPENTKRYLQAAFERASAQQSPSASTLDRFAQLDWTEADPHLGKSLFQQHCVACHQLRGEGKVVGPQLDGAVARSAERLCEDILAPSINVDKAFRNSVIMLDTDTVLTGLVREQADGTLIVVGADGLSQQFAESRVVQRRETSQSLMPSNFAELLSDKQLVSLLRYLNSSATP